MSKFENFPIKNSVEKSPQELASQVESVYRTDLEFLNIPHGAERDERFEQMRKHVENLLESGISDDQLQTELDKLYEEAKDSGIYSPLDGKDSREMLEEAQKKYLEMGYSKEEAEMYAEKDLSRQGFLAELRSWRKDHEREMKRYFSDFINNHEIDKESEKRKIEELKEKCHALNDRELSQEILKDFPGGNYLYHGTSVEQAMAILNSGSIANVKKLRDQSKQEGGEGSVRGNSGFEGISWNFNEIGALPGDRYHLTGFLTSPEGVLNKGLQLSVPSRPSPNELILINGNIDSNHYYASKTQQELLSSFGLGENNSVLNNLIELSNYHEEQKKKEKNKYMDSSLMNDFAQKEMTDEEMCELLKGKYRIKENDMIEFSVDLLQQIKNEIPVGAVWLQSLIDTGRIKNIEGFENVKTVREAMSKINAENLKNVFNELKKDETRYESDVKKEDDKVTPIDADISDMYLVVSDVDLRKWLRIIARCKVQPKGVLIYDRNVIRLENFASRHRGDNQALTETLRKSIPASDGYVDYEKDILGTQITKEKLAGYRKHVIGEQYLDNRKSLKLDDHGKIKLEQ